MAQEAKYASNEIIVTAQRRAERLENVPMSVSVVESDDLQNSGVVNIHDIGSVVAGVQVNFAGNTTQPAVRGVSTLTNGNTVENNVAVYIDGFYEPSPLLINMDLPNVSSIEVLKGPQGTLYGRNATGGALLVNTLAPSPVLTGKAEVTYARFDDKRFSAYASGPLSDFVRVSLAGYYRQANSYVRLVDPTTIGRTIGPATPIEQHAARAKLEADLTENLRATLGFNYTFVDDARTLIFSPRANISPTVPGPPLRPTRIRDAAFSFPTYAPNRRFQGTVKLALQTGIGTLTSYTGYSWNKQWNQFDGDGTWAHMAVFQNSLRQKTFQQAVDFTIDVVKNLDLIVGGMYYQDTIGGDPDKNATRSYLSAAKTLTQLGYLEQKTRAWAIYADATWHVTPLLSLNVGGRYSYDSKHHYAETRTATGTVLNFGPWFAEASWRKFTPRATIRYEIAPRNSVYASFSQGFRGGQFNPEPPNTRTDVWTPVQPERITAYEIGFKTGGSSLRFDLAAYYYDYKDLHVVTNVRSNNCEPLPAICTQTARVFVNAPSAEIYGAEAQVSASPIENLSLRAAIAYLHARYGDLPGVSGTPFNAATGTNLPNQLQDWSGQQTARAPYWTGNLGFDYRFPIGEGGVQLTSNLSFSDSYVINNASLYGPAAGPTLADKQRYRQDAYVNLSASLTWTDSSGHAYVGVFGRNLTNADIFLTKSGNPQFDFGTIGEPTTYGVRAGFRY
jgi:iron complex outermembrane receptor protein